MRAVWGAVVEVAGEAAADVVGVVVAAAGVLMLTSAHLLRRRMSLRLHTVTAARTTAAWRAQAVHPVSVSAAAGVGEGVVVVAGGRVWLQRAVKAVSLVAVVWHKRTPAEARRHSRESEAVAAVDGEAEVALPVAMPKPLPLPPLLQTRGQ
jgi:hypothetical protein